MPGNLVALRCLCLPAGLLSTAARSQLRQLAQSWLVPSAALLLPQAASR